MSKEWKARTWTLQKSTGKLKNVSFAKAFWETKKRDSFAKAFCSRKSQLGLNVPFWASNNTFSATACSKEKFQIHLAGARWRASRFLGPECIIPHKLQRTGTYAGPLDSVCRLMQGHTLAKCVVHTYKDERLLQKCGIPTPLFSLRRLKVAYGARLRKWEEEGDAAATAARVRGVSFRRVPGQPAGFSRNNSTARRVPAAEPGGRQEESGAHWCPRFTWWDICLSQPTGCSSCRGRGLAGLSARSPQCTPAALG